MKGSFGVSGDLFVSGGNQQITYRSSRHLVRRHQMYTDMTISGAPSAAALFLHALRPDAGQGTSPFPLPGNCDGRSPHSHLGMAKTYLQGSSIPICGCEPCGIQEKLILLLNFWFPVLTCYAGQCSMDAHRAGDLSEGCTGSMSTLGELLFCLYRARRRQE